MIRIQRGSKTAAAIVLAALMTFSAIVVEASGAWKFVPVALANARRLPMMAEMADGRVAVVGGGDALPYVDFYDPATDTWSAGPEINVGRLDGVLLGLRDGRLLLAAGDAGAGAIPSAEIYDPATNSWTFSDPDGVYTGAQMGFVELTDGRVLVAGGYDGSYVPQQTTSIFDPVANTWTRGQMLVARAQHNLVRLSDGRAMAIGGYRRDSEYVAPTALTSAEIYDPATNTWSAAAPSAVPHVGSLATLLPDGRVLVAGGSGTPDRPTDFTTVEIYDPATNTWAFGPPLTITRYLPLGGTMFDGRVIVASADRFTGVRTAEELLPGASAWTPIASPQSSGAYLGGLVFGGRQRLLLAGGYKYDGTWYASAEIYKLNHRPVAVATLANPIAQAVPGNLAAISASGAGSSDADGDRLTYTWRSGAAVLAVTNDPTVTATLGLGIGTHPITLTVSDAFGETATADVTATVQAGSCGTEALVGQLTLQLQQTQLQLQQTQTQLRLSQQQTQVHQATITGAETAVELAWRLLLRDPNFELPGATPALKLGSLVAATLTAPTSCQREMYRTLGGRK
jgi:hypothetical protein